MDRSISMPCLEAPEVAEVIPAQVDQVAELLKLPPVAPSPWGQAYTQTVGLVEVPQVEILIPRDPEAVDQEGRFI